MYKDKGITKVVGIESRGFIIGSALAYELNAGLVLIRKPGKLPAATLNQAYELEYGTDTIEIHKDAIEPDDVVLLHDDLLATGGTAEAAVTLLEQLTPKQLYCNFLVELSFLNGRERIKHADVSSLIQY